MISACFVQFVNLIVMIACCIKCAPHFLPFGLLFELVDFYNNCGIEVSSNGSPEFFSSLLAAYHIHTKRLLQAHK